MTDFIHDHNEIVRLFRSGLTWEQVARRLGCSRSTVGRACEAIGVTGQDGGKVVRAARLEAIAQRNEAQARYRKDLLRRHRFFSAVFPPFPGEARA